jgi:hypothetical protein
MDSYKWLFFRYIKSPQASLIDNIYFTLDVGNTDVNRFRLQTEDAPRQSLNLHSGKITDALFHRDDFFDPSDLLQVVVYANRGSAGINR